MDKLITRREVEELTGITRSTIYREMASGRFPLALRIGRRSVRWRSGEIVAWMEARERWAGEGGRRDTA